MHFVDGRKGAAECQRDATAQFYATALRTPASPFQRSAAKLRLDEVCDEVPDKVDRQVKSQRRSLCKMKIPVFWGF